MHHCQKATDPGHYTPLCERARTQAALHPCVGGHGPRPLRTTAWGSTVPGCFAAHRGLGTLAANGGCHRVAPPGGGELDKKSGSMQPLYQHPGGSGPGPAGLTVSMWQSPLSFVNSGFWETCSRAPDGPVVRPWHSLVKQGSGFVAGSLEPPYQKAALQKPSHAWEESPHEKSRACLSSQHLEGWSTRTAMSLKPAWATQ